MKFYATLSLSQARYHRFPKEGYIEINAESRDEAHNKMFKFYGRWWAFLYENLEDVHELDRTKLGEIK